MRVIKVGDKYVGLVDSQRDALRFPDRVPVINCTSWDPPVDKARVIAAHIDNARCIKITTRADRTADSMRGLAGDILDNGNS